MPVDLTRLLRSEDIVCPAGQLRGESACACAIEDTLIEARLNPESIEAFCAGDYTACPSWREEWDRTHEQNKKALSYIEERRAEGERAKQLKEEHRRNRHARARALILGDSDEARRFRRRIGLPDPVLRGGRLSIPE